MNYDFFEDYKKIYKKNNSLNKTNDDFIFTANLSKHKYSINDWVLFYLDKHLCMGQIVGFVPDGAKNKAGAYVIQIKDENAILLYEEEITGKVILNYA